MEIAKVKVLPSKDKRVTLRLYHLLWLMILLLVSCSGVLYKITKQEPIIVETIIVDTVIQKQWITKHDKTSMTVSPKIQSDIVNNLSILLEKKRQGFKLSEWDLFRLEVWQIAGQIKNEVYLPNASRFQVYDWTMKLFWHESGFNGTARNKKSNAKGLFQVMPFVAKEMKIPNLTQISEIKQLPYYKKYILYWLKCQKDTSKINSAGDWYMLGLYPAYAGSSDNFVFAKRNGNRIQSLNYKQNKGLDKNGDGIITKGEIENKLLSHFE